MKTNAQMENTIVMLMQNVKIHQDYLIVLVNQDTLVMEQLVQVIFSISVPTSNVQGWTGMFALVVPLFVYEIHSKNSHQNLPV